MLDWLYWHLGKRAWDLVGAALSLVLAALPLASCMALIRLESPGPALVCQSRVGRGGAPFRLWKLRTMRLEAESDGQPRFATEQARHITRVGAWLRAWHGDELPQLWNVLKGEMSLVGPRPERACFVEQYRAAIPGYERRHLLRPGLTGLAQVSLGYASTLDATRHKTALDLDYLASAGWRRDWIIWCRTWRVARASLRRARQHRPLVLDPASQPTRPAGSLPASSSASVSPGAAAARG